MDVALGRRPADAVFRGGRVVAVHTGEILEADVRELGCRLPGDPFLHLGILAITGVPEIGMSEDGPVLCSEHRVVGTVLPQTA